MPNQAEIRFEIFIPMNYLNLNLNLHLIESADIGASVVGNQDNNKESRRRIFNHTAQDGMCHFLIFFNRFFIYFF